MVSTSTRAGGSSAVTRRVASMPSSPGMRMSISTTSGLQLACLLDRLAPVGGLADDVDVGLGAEDHPKPGADEALVVGEQNADHRADSGNRARTRKPPSGFAPASSSPP